MEPSKVAKLDLEHADTDKDKYYLDSIPSPPVGCRQCARLYEEVCGLLRRVEELEEENAGLREKD